MLTLKNIYRYITLANLMVLLGVCVACNEEMEYIPAAKQTIPMARVAFLENDARIETVRILIFDEKGDLVSNSGKIEVGDRNISDNILTISSEKIAARVSKNHVYVILNEENVILDGVTGNLETNLDAIAKKDDMENLRSKPIKYEEIIAVEEGTEPAFLMCVYDEVDVTSETQTIDLTGNADNGYSMRRSMAKVVLESVIGGVRPDGTIVGTTTRWDGNVSKDQISGDIDNQDLIATSALHILDIELINVPNSYTMRQEGTDNVTSYHDPISIAEPIVPEGEKPKGYFDRTWAGEIKVEGDVPFTRIDQLADIWKVKNASGNSYKTIPLDEVNKIEHYNWAITPNTDVGETFTIEKADADKEGYDHYDMNADGIVTLYKTSDNTMTMEAPSDSKYSLNLGDFIGFFIDTYGNDDTQNYIPGTPVAGVPDLKARVDPAIWMLNLNQRSYYIPENITTDESNQTKLRITVSIAIPTAKLTQDKIDEALADAGAGSLVQDDAKLALYNDKGQEYKENIMKFLYAHGEMVPYTGEDKEKYPNRYAMRYAGLTRKFEGVVNVPSGSKGQYDAITGTTAQIVTIEVPLNNDRVMGNYNKDDYAENTYEGSTMPEGANDHRIYRGTEYRVKLYVTNQSALNQAKSASRTINIGGEELTITGKVTASPIK